jgi:hypothetical protein
MNLMISAVVLDVHGASPGNQPTLVMPGLVPGIHVLCSSKEDVDGRDI